MLQRSINGLADVGGWDKGARPGWRAQNRGESVPAEPQFYRRLTAKHGKALSVVTAWLTVMVNRASHL